VAVDDPVRSALDGEISRLRVGHCFCVVEFSVEGIIVWQIRRDKNGTPYAEHWPPLATSPADAGALDARVMRLLHGGDPVVFVRSSPQPPPAEFLASLSSIDPSIEILACIAGFEDVLRDSIKSSALTHGYELVLLRKTRNGWLDLEPVRLFAQDSRYPAHKAIRVRCARSDERGTVFALVTTEGARGFELMTIQSADLSPGEYHLTAELLRPGRVRFRGLPASVKLRNDRRTWSELVAAIPEKLEAPSPTHLICLVEVCGSADQIRQRVDRARELVRLAESSGGPLAVSVVSYGAHSFERKVREEPVRELAWASPGAVAVAALDDLEQREPVANDYRYAAQLECALAWIQPKVGHDHGRPVLVMVGSRRPFPARHDSRLDILPCPRRHDWRAVLDALARQHPGMTAGAVYDNDAGDVGIWQELGRTATASSEVIEAARFAADLGVRGIPVYVPFPLVWQDGE
jgi:hypothetical protein